ncbi:hypothetical protein CR513_12933, partial [Mucuna pruriens]
MMQIALLTLMIISPPLGPLSSLDPILYLGGPRSKFHLDSTQALCDNMSTFALTHILILHARTKNMELDLFFIREKVINKLLQVTHVSVVDQCVDILTKALSPTCFLTFQTKLRVMDSSLSHPS